MSGGSARIHVATLALFGLLLAGPAAAQSYVIRDVVFRSNVAVDRDEVERLAGLTVGGEIETTDLAPIRLRLESTNLFDHAEVSLSADADGSVDVIIELQRHSRIDSISFRGNRNIRDDSLLTASRLQVGAPFEAAGIQDAIERIRATYQEDGFAQVQVRVETSEPQPASMQLVIHVREGKRRCVADVVVRGAPPGLEGRVRRALGFKRRSEYRPKRRRQSLADVMKALRKGDFLEADVDVVWTPDDANCGILEVVIDAGPKVLLSVVGNEAISEKHLLALIDLSRRFVVSDGTWRDLGRRIKRAYQEEGYYRAEVGVDIAAGDPKRIVYRVQEGQPFKIASVDFEGAVGVPPEVLRRGLVTGPPSWIPWRQGVFLDDVFQQDLKRLWFQYRRLGFQDAEITDYRIQFDEKRGEMRVLVIVEEGPLTTVGSIEVHGLPDDVVPPKLHTAVGAPLDSDALDDDRHTVTNALLRMGYAEAAVKAETTSRPVDDAKQADVTITTEPGAQRHVGEVVVQNNFETQAEVIRRELPLTPGMPLDPEALLQGQSRIYRLGLFRSVAVEPDATRDAQGRSPISIRVVEKPPWSAQSGIGYNSRDGLRLFVEAGNYNMQGRGRRLSLRGDVSLEPKDFSKPNEYVANLSFREPRVIDSWWNLRANLIAQRATRSIDHYSIERFAFVPAIDREILYGLQVGAEVQIEDARLFDVEPDLVAFNPRDVGSLRTVGFGPFMIYDRRDDPFSPTRGTYDSMRLRVAPPGLGSDVPFAKLQLQHSQYVPIAAGVTFIYALRGGWAHTLDGGIVPLRERLFLGGRTTVRGYEENSVGPRGDTVYDSNGKVVFNAHNPLGGDLAINGNAEIRFPLIFGIEGATFFDWGAVYLTQRPLRFEDIRYGAGPGLRYNTPVGPIALDYGFKVNRRDDESIGEFHFSIGASF